MKLKVLLWFLMILFMINIIILTILLINGKEISPQPNGDDILLPPPINKSIPTYFTVTKVIDGDTIDIDTGERVRLICIDSPEYYNEGYEESKEFLEDLILGKEVKLEKDISEVGKYGRLVRHVYLPDGTFVNELIVKEGYATAYWYEPDTTLCPIIQKAEDYARRNELGIWAEVEEKDEEEDYEEDDNEEEVVEPKPSEEVCDCSSNIYNCADFSTHNGAQACFEYCLSVKGYDIHWLDGDEDGEACESLGY